MSGPDSQLLGGGPGVAADNTLTNRPNVTSGTAILGKASSASIHAVSSVSGALPRLTLQLGGTGTDFKCMTPNNISAAGRHGLSETIGALSGTGGDAHQQRFRDPPQPPPFTQTPGTFSGTIGNGAAVAGIVALTVPPLGLSANTWPGLTTVSGGTLNLAKANAIGSGGLTITGGTLNINNAETFSSGCNHDQRRNAQQHIWLRDLFPNRKSHQHYRRLNSPAAAI